MTIVYSVDSRGAPPEFQAAEWKDCSDRRLFRCRVHLAHEDTGYSVYAADLPGVASQGETKDEAMSAIRDAYVAAISEYIESGSPIPWLNPPREPERGEEALWIEVDATPT